jgi:chemotaxis response regulator CheB
MHLSPNWESHLAEVLDRRTALLVRQAADTLFRSVAAVYEEKTIGVVLTGGDHDGSTGVRAIKHYGGKTIAQDDDSSRNPEMPRHAVGTGCIDRVVPLEEIVDAFRTLVGEEALPD